VKIKKLPVDEAIKKETGQGYSERDAWKDPKRFIRDHFKTDPDKNVKIIDKITVPL
jgi:hypothetical protein